MSGVLTSIVGDILKINNTDADMDNTTMAPGSLSTVCHQILDVVVQGCLNGTTLTLCPNSTGGGNLTKEMDPQTESSSSSDKDMQDFMIGLCLAVSSSVFIGSSFIFKKLGLLRYAKKVSIRAGKGGFGYLREWMWWAGMILMTVGEFVNFAAYAFAPATLVTPLGALSVIVSAILAARVLKERLNILGKVGCVLCVLGSTVMVIHSPKEQEVHDVEDLMVKMKEPGFIVFGIGVVLLSSVMIGYFAPRYGQKNVLIYVTICATLGSLTVMGCKGVGVAIKATARGQNEFKNWLTYVLLAVVITCILLQLNYLNKALDTFNTAVVTPIYYVFFTSFVIMGSAILFQEFFKMGALDIIGDACGFLTIVSGIFLLNAFKDMKISWRNIPNATKSADSGNTAAGSNTNADDEVFTNGTALGMNGVGVTNTNYILDCHDIEARISRNMSTECITRNMSEESDFNDNGHAADRYHGSSPVQF
ncbi:Magnesium transporter nipa2 [Plakobranchus ocellatus]|uniref:Magnesium transporter nipa2 n=1 Tax=Plakobranchus ocellatus TaxID=259542 RepID=A0AAV3YEB2_9GAST|nr:Magnesium transporter nipa2 [Plakobranchus ocellatus]